MTCNAIRTISEEVVLVVVGIIPVGILAEERSVLYHARRIEGQAELRNVARSELYGLGYTKWDEGPLYMQVHSQY